MFIFGGCLVFAFSFRDLRLKNHGLSEVLFDGSRITIEPCFS